MARAGRDRLFPRPAELVDGPQPQAAMVHGMAVKLAAGIGGSRLGRRLPQAGHTVEGIGHHRWRGEHIRFELRWAAHRHLLQITSQSG